MFRKKSRFRRKYFREGFKDLPGFDQPSVEDVRFEALLFEKRVKQYLGGIDKGNKSLISLIKDLEERKPAGAYSVSDEQWASMMNEFHQLRVYRNRIIHWNNTESLPPVKELYERYKKANEYLLPFGINSASRDRFEAIKWLRDSLHFKIDGILYVLHISDIYNLMLELHPLSRGKVNFLRGKMVAGKIHDYRYENITFYVEDYPPFTLSQDEASVLEDWLSSHLGRYTYGS